MKKILFVLLLLTTFMISSCSTSQIKYGSQTAMVGLDVIMLRNSYTNVEKSIRFKQDTEGTFTEEEWQKLKNVDYSIDSLIQKYDKIKGKQLTEINFKEIDFMWALAEDGYAQAREVVINHWDELDSETKALVHSFDEQAIETSNRITNLLEKPEYQNINQSLQYVSSIMYLAIGMVNVGTTL